MTNPSKTPVIDLTKDDDVIYVSSNEASDGKTMPASPCATASRAGTPNSKRRKRRKKTKALSLSTVIAEQVKLKLSAPLTAESIRGGADVLENSDKLTREQCENSNLGNMDREMPLNKGISVLRKQSSSPLSFFEVDASKGEVSIADAWDGGLPGSASGPKLGSKLEWIQGLLLPSHATVIGEGSAAIEKIMLDAEASFAEFNHNEETFMEFQDEDKGFRRYWEIEEHEDERKRSMVCARCGEEGHRMKACTAIICEKCGVRDEHLTRSCPVSKKCFTCGMTGHINKDCPNRYARIYEMGCDRCGSTKHVSLECPSLWRVYKYLSDKARRDVCTTRAESANLPLLEGGAAYIPLDEWCYFCGQNGHLGDDCPDSKYNPYQPEEPSAFGSCNLQTGPFSDIQISSSKRVDRQRGADQRLAGPFASDFGSQPGKRSREKLVRNERERARRQQERDDEEDDWFGRQKEEGGSGRNDKRSLLERMDHSGRPGKHIRGGRERVSEKELYRIRRVYKGNWPRYHGGYDRD